VAGQQRSDGVEAGIRIELRGWRWRCNAGACDRASGEVEPRATAPVGERERARGEAVHTVYESCGFGYTLHEQLSVRGARFAGDTRMRLNLERKEERRIDARELCVRLSRYLDGQSHELRPFAFPLAASNNERELGRQRSFWKREGVAGKHGGATHRA